VVRRIRALFVKNVSKLRYISGKAVRDQFRCPVRIVCAIVHYRAMKWRECRTDANSLTNRSKVGGEILKPTNEINYDRTVTIRYVIHLIMKRFSRYSVG